MKLFTVALLVISCTQLNGMQNDGTIFFKKHSHELEKTNCILSYTYQEYIEALIKKRSDWQKFLANKDNAAMAMNSIKNNSKSSDHSVTIAVILDTPGTRAWAQEYIEIDAAAYKALTSFLDRVCQWVEPDAQEMAQKILAIGCKPTADAMSFAILHNNKTLFNLFLANKLDVNKKNTFNGNTPLITAAMEGNVEMLNILIEQKADINAQNTFGSTALALAAYYGKTEAVKLLLDTGADETIAEPEKNKTALDRADDAKYRPESKAIIALLKAAAEKRKQSYLK